ncbi:unnamed protein product [Cunninghamella echinulata]
MKLIMHYADAAVNPLFGNYDDAFTSITKHRSHSLLSKSNSIEYANVLGNDELECKSQATSRYKVANVL